MDWSRLQHQIPFEKNFRWRGGQVSRIEAFADGVFALSITLLVVSADAPGSYAELIGIMKALPAFALSFTLLVMVWYFHFIQFRRYGIEDFTTTFLTLLLLFVALIYVYPLKLMWGFLLLWTTSDLDTAVTQFGLGPEAAGNLLAIYGAGVVAMYVLLAFMAAHSLKLRDELELNEVEVVLARGLIATHCIQAGVGTVSVLMALLIPSPWQGLAGFAYFLLPIVHAVHGLRVARQERVALERMERRGVAAADVTAAPG